MASVAKRSTPFIFWQNRMHVQEKRSPMDKNAQSLSSTSTGSNHHSIGRAAGRGDPINGSIVSLIKRPFDLRAPHGYAWRQPGAAVVQEVVAKRRALRTAAVIAVAFGIISLDTSSVVAGQCADAIQRIESALDELTSNPDTSAVAQGPNASAGQPSFRCPRPGAGDRRRTASS
jgi:hypothetical protein